MHYTLKIDETKQFLIQIQIVSESVVFRVGLFDLHSKNGSKVVLSL